MSKNVSFFSLSEAKQPVNQWLCIAFLSVWCFWIVLYYMTEKTQAYAYDLSYPTTAALHQSVQY